MGRTKLYRPSHFSIGEKKEYERIRGLIEDKHSRQRRVYAEFLAFLQKNNLGDDSGQRNNDGLLKYTVALRYYTQDPGYIVGQLRDIRAERRRGGQITMKSIEDFWNEEKARLGTWRAKDHDADSLITALNSFPQHDCRTQLAMMLLAGVRNEDLSGTAHIVVSADRFIADIMISKQRKSASDRATLKMPRNLNVFEKFSEGLQADIKEWVSRRRTELLTTQTERRTRESLGENERRCQKVGATLRYLRRQRFEGTTYTFRRAYIQRIIKYYTNANDVVDWPSVTSLTLHFSEKIVKSVYSKMASAEATSP